MVDRRHLRADLLVSENRRRMIMSDTPEDHEAAIAGPDDAETEAERKARLLKAGIGIGVGSAALVAALLYANKPIARRRTSPTHPPIDRD
jgi:hypothetical protein